MKAVTVDWLSLANADLLTIDTILPKPELSAVVAFHAQQCVEKCFKALLEESGAAPLRTHNLLTLKAAIENFGSFAFKLKALGSATHSVDEF